MSIEVEKLASKIEVARMEARKKFEKLSPPVTELPDGLYDEKQFGRYRRADTLIHESVEKVFKEIGINSFEMVRDFSRLIKHPSNKGVSYLLKFSASAGVEFEKDDHKVIKFRYDPGGRFNNESLHMRGFFVAPHKKRYSGWFNLKDVISYSNSTEANEYVYSQVGTFDITSEDIANMVRIGLSGARTIKPNG